LSLYFSNIVYVFNFLNASTCSYTNRNQSLVNLPSDGQLNVFEEDVPNNPRHQSLSRIILSSEKVKNSFEMSWRKIKIDKVSFSEQPVGNHFFEGYAKCPKSRKQLWTWWTPLFFDQKIWKSEISLIDN